MKYPVNYETERLIIRSTTIEDADFVLKILNSEKWLKYIGDRNVHTLKEAEDYIKQKMLPQFEKIGFGNFIVVNKETGGKIGSCGLYDREGIDGFDIGFAFLPTYENKGFAYESSQKVRDLAFTTFGIKKLSAITTQDNFSSQKLLEKLGFIFIKLTEISNDDEVLMLYELEK